MDNDLDLDNQNQEDLDHLGEDQNDDATVLAEKNKKLYARAKRAETLVKELKSQTKDKPNSQVKPPEPPDTEITKRVETLEVMEQKREFGFKHSLSPAEVDAIWRHTGGKEPEKALDDDFIKGGLEAIRAKRRVEDNTPGASKRGFNVEGKGFNDLPREEKIKNFGKFVKDKTGKGE